MGRMLRILGLTLWLAGCQHFVNVTHAGAKPVFSWPGGVPASGLTVRPVMEDCKFKGPHSPDQIWWHISGEIHSPVTYGVVPKGVTEHVVARPLSEECDTWVVTVTDQSMRGESTEF